MNLLLMKYFKEVKANPFSDFSKFEEHVNNLKPIPPDMKAR
jgi:hypothetical protein